MTTSEPNARRYSRRCRQRRMARRRNAMVIMAILAVLATVFALGYASGCSAHQTDDEVKTPEPVVTMASCRSTLSITSGFWKKALTP